MADDVQRPLPRPTPVSHGFWEAARRGELAIQRCDACRVWRHYPQPMCPTCHSLDWHYETVSGRGRIHSYIIAHQAFHPWWKERVPYVVATIELEEGVRLVDDMLELPPDQVAIGLPVQVFFEPQNEEITLPKFRLAS